MSNDGYNFKYLFSPYKVGNIEIKNRFVFQPHVPYFASQDGYPTETMKRYYLERAKGGNGLIIIESLMVHPSGIYAPGCILMYNEGIVDAFKDFTERIHKYGAKVFGQLSHPGANIVARPAQLASAPSQIPDINGRVVPKELDVEEIEDIITGFALAAQRLKEAGFDGCELKFAHDGLLRAFASSVLNHRTDKYGGSYENRLRFFTEIVSKIRKSTGQDFAIGVRLCIDEFVEGGITETEGIRFARTCEEAGCDYINGDSGDSMDASMQIFPMGVPLGAGVYLASAVKKAVNIPVVAFGRVNDPVLMEMILEEGHADFVGSARQFICDPETANKAQEGRLDDIRHCIACNEACIYQCVQAKPIHCCQNPAAGREETLGMDSIVKTDAPRRILVIGGGIAGMKFSEIAAKRGHKVVLYEKEDILGGQINLAEKLPYRSEISEVVRYIRFQLQKLNVEYHVGIEVNAEMVQMMNPDIVVTATGSRPFYTPVKGTDNTNVKIVDVRYALRHPEEIGNKVVVFDRQGHMQAAGITEYALALGAEVHYYTPYDKIGVDVDTFTMQLVKRRLFDSDDFHYNVYYELEELTSNGLRVRQCYSGRVETIENVDTLIYAQYSQSDTALYKELKAKRDNVYSIGDCNAPRLIEQVIYESEMLARSL